MKHDPTTCQICNKEYGIELKQNFTFEENEIKIRACKKCVTPIIKKYFIQRLNSDSFDEEFINTIREPNFCAFKLLVKGEYFLKEIISTLLNMKKPTK